LSKTLTENKFYNPTLQDDSLPPTSEVGTFGFVLLTTSNNITQQYLFERCAIPSFINIHPIDLTFFSRFSHQARPVFDSLDAEFLGSQPTQATEVYPHVVCVRVSCFH